MDWENEWLTKEDYATAKANGISYKTAYQRFHDYGWDKERTITEKVKPKAGKLWLQFKDTCKQNNVDSALFNTRLGHGWTPERASSTPRMTREDRNKQRAEKWELEKPDSLRLAEQNGISYKVWYRRMKLGWDPMDAATVPVGSKGKSNNPKKKVSMYEKFNGVQ